MSALISYGNVTSDESSVNWKSNIGGLVTSVAARLKLIYLFLDKCNLRNQFIFKLSKHLSFISFIVFSREEKPVELEQFIFLTINTPTLIDCYAYVGPVCEILMIDQSSLFFLFPTATYKGPADRT